MDNFILAANNNKDNWKQFYTFFVTKKNNNKTLELHSGNNERSKFMYKELALIMGEDYCSRMAL
jgi:hypothetical protein